MPLNFHIPLPGPFTYSARVTPDLRPVARTIGEIARAGQTTTRRPENGPAALSEDAYALLGLVIGALLLPVEWWLLGMWF